jgi:hypothetical protein
MATQQAGLFTQGPSVEDLLQQRNTRAKRSGEVYHT